MPVAPTPAIDRILRRIDRQPNGCWVWQGATTNGYGIVQLGRGIGTARTHRVSYEHFRGPIPQGWTIDHLCANTRCCNPDHLEAVTRAENAERQGAAGRADPGRRNRAKTHCRHGHPFDEANTRICPKGKRVCRTCAREWARKNRPSRRASRKSSRS